MNKKTTLPMWKSASLKRTEVVALHFKRKYTWDFTKKEAK